jgi:hypothetical protein
MSILAVGGTSYALRANDLSESSLVAHVQTAQFRIPFNVESRGADPLKVQLWVSADNGETWQSYGSVSADTKSFDFRAAAEGTYLFKVATIDAAGTTYPNLGQPLRVQVDTTKPQAEIQADINEHGQLVVNVKVREEYLEPGTALLRVRSDQTTQWLDLPIELRETDNAIYSGQAVTDLPGGRDVAIVFSVKDRALNEGEATYAYSVPRTAAGGRDVTLASNKHEASPSNSSSRTLGPPAASPRITAHPGATRWNPTNANTERAVAAANSGAPQAATTGTATPGPAELAAPGRLTSSGQLSLEPPQAVNEEIPLPAPLTAEEPFDAPYRQFTNRSLPLDQPADQPPTEPKLTAEDSSQPASTIGRAFHCKTRAFSLDYSVEALGGSALADVELWGTEDGGRQWQKWGSDPDRVSPFDVQVGNDGLFGFRMVIVGTNGVVSNRPREGDSADVWINVDSSLPSLKITRAVYGEGPEDGLLVIDYSCQDGHLVERPIALTYSERPEGPWTEIATGLANSGLYLWKAPQTLPNKIYLKIEGVDKAGNIGSHRLDLPIDIRGLAPRGIIQGFRPIENPTAR